MLNCGDILVNYSKLRKISRYLTVQSRMEILIRFEFRGILRHMFKLRFLFDFNVQLTKIPHHSGFRLPFNSSDGFFRKDYGNRNRKQFAPAVVFFAKQGTETERTYGPVAPRGRRRAIFFLRCRSASESVFARIFDQNFQGFIDSKKCFQTQKFWRFVKFTIWESNI